VGSDLALGYYGAIGADPEAAKARVVEEDDLAVGIGDEVGQSQFDFGTGLLGRRAMRSARSLGLGWTRSCRLALVACHGGSDQCQTWCCD
jgi:hypothetical protein